MPRAQTVTADDFRPRGRLIDVQQGVRNEKLSVIGSTAARHTNAIPKLSRRLSELLVALPWRQVVDLGSPFRCGYRRQSCSCLPSFLSGFMLRIRSPPVLRRLYLFGSLRGDAQL